INATVLSENEITLRELDGLEPEEMVEEIMEKVTEDYNRREEEFTAETMREFERVILLRTVDSKWTSHIDQMDQLRQGIHLRAYGQNDPLREYK
ncbi:hypothetical protein AOA57_27835, partial [Pseudomonas sp. 2588-5]